MTVVKSWIYSYRRQDQDVLFYAYSSTNVLFYISLSYILDVPVYYTSCIYTAPVIKYSLHYTSWKRLYDGFSNTIAIKLSDLIAKIFLPAHRKFRVVNARKTHFSRINNIISVDRIRQPQTTKYKVPLETFSVF